MNKYDVEKVANTIIFFLDAGVEHLGKTKLMKLMFFADKYHLKKYLRPIFSDTYIKLPYGPVPTLTLNIIDSINEAEKDDLESYVNKFLEYLDVTENIEGNFIKTVFIKKQDFNAKIFSPSELEILKYIAEEFKTHTAQQISDYSHTLTEYQYTDDNEVISYISIAPEHREYFEMIQDENKEFKELIIK